MMDSTGNDSDNDMDILGQLLEDTEDTVAIVRPPENTAGTAAQGIIQEKTNETVTEVKGVRALKLTDIFSKNELPSVIHSGDTDSSEDEDNKYFQQQGLNEYGKNLKELMDHKTASKGNGLGLPFEGSTGMSKTWDDKNQLAAPARKIEKAPSEMSKIDPICGIRVINPLVSSTSFTNKVDGRKVVMMSYIQNHINNGDLDADWVTVGVIVQKSPVQKSQKGSQYCILTLSDLKLGLKKVALFLFSNSFKEHWKHPLGTVIGILNPNILNNKDAGTIATLSVDNAKKLMVIGTSKDFGYCKSWKKNGEKCTAFVNLGDCAYCVYHVQKEYRMFSQRSELQSPGGGKLHDLRNKVLGKNEVFYAGKSFVASKKSSKTKEKDDQRLKKLTDFYDSNPRLETSFANALPITGSLSVTAKMKDANRLNILMESTTNIPSTSMSSASQSVLQSEVSTRGKYVLESLKNLEKKKEVLPSQIMNNLKISEVFGTPKLGRGANSSNVIDLDSSYSRSQKSRAKMQALAWVKKNGPLKKDDPNAVKKETKACDNDRKRKREPEKKGDRGEVNQNGTPNELCSRSAGKSPLSPKFTAEKMKELMERTSKHADLLEIADLEAKDEYFDKLEKKEQMEEKMLNTFKVDCKAVRCLKCKYLAFSASDFCKSEGHPIKVVNAVKRFYKCHDCGYRTISLEKFPVKPCNKCGGAQWERTSMLREKKGPVLPTEQLSIRGFEETFIGSMKTDGILDLLVPES